jgi:serine/threonine-protein kinase PknK
MRPPDFGYAEIVAQLDDATAIRGQMTDQPGIACERAEAWVRRVEAQNRPRATLQAKRLLVACLVAADRVDEAKPILAEVVSTCARIGFVRYVVDGGPRMIPPLAALLADKQGGRWPADWPEVSADFLAAALAGHTPLEN